MLFIKEASHAREISRTIMHLCWIIYDHKSLLWSVSPNPPGGGASINTHIRSRMVFILSGAIPRGILPLVAGSPALTSTSAGRKLNTCRFSSGWWFSETRTCLLPLWNSATATFSSSIGWHRCNISVSSGWNNKDCFTHKSSIDD